MLHARPAVSIRARRLFPLRRCRPLPVVLERVGLLLALRRLQPLHPIVPILHIHSVQPICFCRPFIRLPTRYALRRDALLHYTRLFLSKKGKEFRGEQGQPDGAQRACWFSCPTPTAMEIPAFGSVCKTHCVQQNRVRWPSRPRTNPPISLHFRSPLQLDSHAHSITDHPALGTSHSISTLTSGIKTSGDGD